MSSRRCPRRSFGRGASWLLVALGATSTPAAAGGLWIYEYGAPAMGRAGAGAEAGVEDASTNFYNPASMTRLDSSQLMATGGFAASRVAFDLRASAEFNGAGDGGEAGGVTPGAGLFYMRPVGDRLRLGANIAGLTGSALDYDDDWAGRFQATDVSLLLLVAAVTAGYRVTDRWSVGVGVQLGYTELEQELRVPNPGAPADGFVKLDGDDVETAFSLSTHYVLSAATRMGIVYQSEYEPNYEGGVTVDPAGLAISATTVLPLAETVRAGIVHELDDRWALHGSVGWDNWSRLDAALVNGEQAGVALQRNWEDTWHVALGVTHEVSERWALQGGFGYDSSPVSSANRTADLPVDRQRRYALGVRHRRPSGLDIAAHAVFADLGDAEIVSARAPGSGFSGRYDDNDAFFFSVSFNWVR